MWEDRSDLTLAILTDIFKTQMSLVTPCLKTSLVKETKMSHAVNPATTGLAKLLDPVAECFTPEVAKRVAELAEFSGCARKGIANLQKCLVQ